MTDDELREFIRAEIRRSPTDMRSRAGGRRVAGTIRGSDGVVLSGAGFTAVRSATGVYAVTFVPAFRSPPAVAAIAVNWTMCLGALPTVSGFAVSIFVAGDPWPQSDQDWSFIAIG